MRTLALVIALATTPGSAAALAQDRRAPPQEVTTYGEDAWTDDLVTGDLLRPDGDLIRGPLRPRHVTLLRIRTNFVKEMLKSVENQ